MHYKRELNGQDKNIRYATETLDICGLRF